MILVTTLFFLGLAIALVIQLQVSAQLALRHEERRLRHAQLRVAATDAALFSLTRLATEAELHVTHTNEAWALPLEQLLPNGISTRVTLTDENRYFDVNSLSVHPTNHVVRLPVDVVRDILSISNRSDAAEAAEALQDWIDTDNDGARERAYYLGRNLPFEIPNAPMESPEELVAVGGIRPGDADARAALTVLPGEQVRVMPINVNTSARDVLLAVFGLRNFLMVETMCRLRDVQPLPAVPSQFPALKAFSTFLTTKSSFFSVQATAERDDAQACVYGLAQRDDRGQFKIIRWVCQ